MKKYLFLCLVIVAGLSGCKKDKTDDFDSVAQSRKDYAALDAYFKANNITPVSDPSGIYYTIDTPGTGAYPTSASTVTVSYVGKLLNGTVFDQSDSYSATLSTGVILGWTIGVPRINVGGTITLYLPSAMGYGNVANGNIPENSPLIFTIKLISIQ